MRLRKEVMTEPKTTMASEFYAPLFIIIGLALCVAVMIGVYMIDRLEETDSANAHRRWLTRTILQHAECTRPPQCVGLRLLSEECATRLIELSGAELSP